MSQVLVEVMPLYTCYIIDAPWDSTATLVLSVPICRAHTRWVGLWTCECVWGRVGNGWLGEINGNRPEIMNIIKSYILYISIQSYNSVFCLFVCSPFWQDLQHRTLPNSHGL